MKHSFKERFAYWFDTHMAKGSRDLIKFLAIVTVAAVALVSVLLVALGYSESKNGFDVFWDSFATIINAEMPAYEDGGGEIAHLIITAVAAIIGILITSVLIGIITTAIEEYVDGLKDGKSVVLEKDHIVILGFTPGDYTLIQQIILAAGNKKRTIVIGSDTKTEEMREAVTENVDIPRNIKLIFRTIDIFDPASLEKVSPATSNRVIISPMDDKKTIKALLAVSLLINSTDNEKVRVSALISENEYEFPETVAAKHNVTTIHLHKTIAKIVALSCTQTGLSDAFRELFNFEGSEFYATGLAGSAGLKFGELALRLDKAVPVGVIRGDEVVLNPEKDFSIEEGDRLIVFSEEKESAVLTGEAEYEALDNKYQTSDADRKVAIIGYNSSIKIVFEEMSDDISEVIVAGIPEGKKEAVMKLNKREDRKLTFYERDIDEPDNIFQLANVVDHVVLLSDYKLPDEDADIQSIFRIMRFRDIRTRFDLDYNITAEMRKKSNLNLIREEDHLDYVVSTNMSSLFLAQLSENYELTDVFREILSNKGNELHLKKAKDFGLDGTYTTQQLRGLAIDNSFVLLGYMRGENYESFFNPGLKEEIKLGSDDSLIVLAEK